MKKSKIIWGLVIVCIAALIWLGNLGILAFSLARDWPIILIVIGLFMIYRGVIYPLRRKRTVHREKPGTIDVVLDDLENGKIDADEAVKKIKRED